MTATGVTPTAADPPAKMLDGHLTTRSSSGEGQDDDMSLTVDPRSYVVQVCDDEARWRSIGTPT